MSFPRSPHLHKTIVVCSLFFFRCKCKKYFLLLQKYFIMILYDNIRVMQDEYNELIKGLNNSYTFISVSPKLAKKYLKGKNVLCMASVTNIDSNDCHFPNFTHIGFYQDTEEFFKIDDWLGVHYMFFKEINEFENVNIIIEDIKSYYKESLFNN